MAGDSFGTLFRFTSFGESHGPGIGCVIEGVPPGIPLTVEEIQIWLDRRRPGQSRFTTQRQEPDAVEILSGVFEGKTTGTALALLIRNQDQRSKDYGEIATRFRPGHGDFTYWARYQGMRDYRGGGRASARETAVRVAAGAVARKILTHELQPLGFAPRIRGALVAIGSQAIDPARWDWVAVEANPFWCPDPVMAAEWETALDQIRKEGSSIGAVIALEAEGLPPGLGEPVYDRLDADIAKAMMGINAVKGVEIGAGFAAATLRGEDNADEMLPDPLPSTPGTEAEQAGLPVFTSNHAGGILGGISSGQPITVRFAVKPTSSILIPRRSLDISGAPVEVRTKGRHDPCVGIRAVPVGEAMLASVLADHWLRFKAQCLQAGSLALPWASPT